MVRPVSILGVLTALLLLSACATSGATSIATPSETPTIVPSPTATVVVPSHTVKFTTSDGMKLDGTIYGRGRTALIFSNQTDTAQRDWAPFAQLAASKGYLALVYDYRGRGDSQGSFIIDKLDTDVRAAIAFVHSQGARQVALIGASIGGAATARAAAAEHVNAVVILSAPADFTGLEADDTVIEHLGAPTLFLNSIGDEYSAAIQHMYDVAAQPKQIKLYPGVDHGVELVYDDKYGAEVQQLILTFLATYAAPSP